MPELNCVIVTELHVLYTLTSLNLTTILIIRPIIASNGSVIASTLHTSHDI